MQDTVNATTDRSASRSRRPVGQNANLGRRASDRCEPELDVQRSAGRVVAISIRCACGQEIMVDCEYDREQER